MCTRFFIEIDNKELQEIIKTAEQFVLARTFLVKYSNPLKKSGEIFPTNVVAAIAPGRTRDKAVFPMKWGFSVDGLERPVVNARVETAADKPLFKESWLSRRCVIPASFYYEWEHMKIPNGISRTGARYAIQPTGSLMTYLCGLYRFEGELPVFAILTRNSTGELVQIHDRMPLILPEDKIDEWILPGTDPKRLLPYAVTEVVFEKT